MATATAPISSLIFRRLRADAAASLPTATRMRAQLVYRSELLRRLGDEMAPSAYRGGWRSERTTGGDARGQPRFHPAQPSGGGGDLRGGERWGSPPLRESAGGALHALRGSTGLQPLRRSASARSSRAPNFLRHLTKEGQARRRHLDNYGGPANCYPSGFPANKLFSLLR